MHRRAFLAGAAALTLPSRPTRAATERHLLYIAQPGIRNYVSYGGIGRARLRHRPGPQFVRRIPTWSVRDRRRARERQGDRRQRAGPDGSTSAPSSGVGCIDLVDREDGLGAGRFEGGCDRHVALARRSSCSTSRPSRGRTGTSSTALTGEVDRQDGDRLRRAQHPLRLDGSPGLSGRPALAAAVGGRHAAPTRSSRRWGRSPTRSGRSRSTRAQTLCYVNVNELLGFEIGDLRTGKKLHRVEVQGYEKGPVDRHGCPSHGIGLTPDEQGAVAVRRAQQRRARLRQHGHAAPADDHAQGARSAGLDHVQHRRQARLSVDRRGVRHPDARS